MHLASTISKLHSAGGLIEEAGSLHLKLHVFLTQNSESWNKKPDGAGGLVDHLLLLSNKVSQETRQELQWHLSPAYSELSNYYLTSMFQIS